MDTGTSAVTNTDAAPSGSLPFQRTIFRQALNEDGLFVIAKGLGLQLVFSKLVKLYCTMRRLVLVLNANDSMGAISDALMSDGVDTGTLPILVDAETSAQERQRLYSSGRVLFITARILMVDLLRDKLPEGIVAGLLVCNAERIYSEDAPEAGIRLLIHQKHPQAFVKAFSDDAESLISGFNRLEQTLRALMLEKVSLWPRFSVLVTEDLARNAPVLEEVRQPLTPLMESVQRAVVQCMDVCCAEISRQTRIDMKELTLERCLFDRIDVQLRRELDPTWDKLSASTKGLVSDVRTLRKLLDYLVRYDAASFYMFLDVLRAEALQNGVANATSHSWVFSDAGDLLFRAARERLYVCALAAPDAAARPPEVRSFLEAPLEVEDRRWDAGTPATSGRKRSAATAPVVQRVYMRTVLEHNPKWAALRGVLQEVQAHAAATAAANPSRLHSASALMVARDKRTCRLLSEVLTDGAEGILERGYIQFLTKHALRTRTLRAAVLQEYGSIEHAIAAMPDEARRLLPEDCPRDERELWVAAHVANLRPDSDAAARTRGGKSTDLLKKVAGASSDAAGLAQVIEDLKAAYTVPGEPTESNDAIGTTAAPPSTAVSSAMDSGPSTANAASTASQPPAARPHVLPEQRLLWKATAQLMEKQRQVLLTSNADLLAAYAQDHPDIHPESMTLSELQSTEAEATGVGAVDVVDITALGADGREATSAVGGTAPAASDGAPGPDTADLDTMVQDVFGAHGARKRQRAQPASSTSAAVAREHSATSTATRVLPDAGDDDELLDLSKVDMLPPASAAASGSHVRAAPRGRGGPRRRSAARGRMPTGAAASQAPDARQRTGSGVASIMPASPLHIVIHPLSQESSHARLLSDLSPDYVIMYDPDASFTREMEVYLATIARRKQVRIYFMVYTGSAEEQRFLSAIKQENDAFTRLINEKAHMAPAPPRENVVNEAIPGVITRKAVIDEWGMTSDGIGVMGGRAGGTAGALVALTAASSGGRPRARLPVNVPPLIGDIGVEDRGMRKIIVDMREFRAKIVVRLQRMGLTIVPATLEVGDFVLSPKMVVERKTVGDLKNSLNNGRLYTQADAMVRLYERPVLCIEFEDNTAFKLHPSPHLPAELEISHPVSKLVLLTLHFPTLRILWCRSPNTVATYFAALKQMQDEPDEAVAKAVSSDASRLADEDESAAHGALAEQLLRSMPGVNAVNVRDLMLRGGSLAGIASLTRAELEDVMRGNGADALYAFLHQSSPL